MRILFASYAYPNAGQPQLATFNCTMLAGLARRHAVRVVAPVPFVQSWRRPPVQEGYTAISGVSVEHPTFYYPPKVLRDRYDEFLWWSIRSTLRRAIREFRPDVVLSYWAHPDGAVAVRAAREAGIPAVVMVGGSDVLVLGRSGARRRVILNVLQQADAVVAVSEDLAQTLRDDGLDAERLSVVRRGVARETFHPGNQKAARQELGLPEDRPVLLGVGRLVDVKDWPTWLEACRALRESGRRPACYVLGSGPLQNELVQIIDTNGLGEFVELRGSQSQSDLARWYRAADLTVLSSRSEGVPNVLLETIASGTSFVATRVGGIPEIADPVCDRLVPPGNARALAEAIADRLDHPPPTNWLRRFEPDTNEQASDRLARTLETVVARTSRPRGQIPEPNSAIALSETH